ncbi:transposase [Pseudomonas oryzihabitans]|nr:transposase [Pseudomonas psychrotolerans]
MPRHSQNHNLSIHDLKAFKGLPIMYEKGPFIREHLQRLHDVMQQALDDYAQVFAFRVDLKLPASGMLPSYASTNEVIRRFLASFKAKIEHNRSMARRSNRYAHDSKVRYVWVREVAGSGRPHYHLVILLNRSAFRTLGYFRSERGNIFNRLEEAWASALRLERDAVVGLVHIPENADYHLTRGDVKGQEAFFRRASYLCKVATKVYGDGQHSFDASRG